MLTSCVHLYVNTLGRYLSGTFLHIIWIHINVPGLMPEGINMNVILLVNEVGKIQYTIVYSRTLWIVLP